MDRPSHPARAGPEVHHVARRAPGSRGGVMCRTSATQPCRGAGVRQSSATLARPPRTSLFTGAPAPAGGSRTRHSAHEQPGQRGVAVRPMETTARWLGLGPAERRPRWRSRRSAIRRRPCQRGPSASAVTKLMSPLWTPSWQTKPVSCSKGQATSRRRRRHRRREPPLEARRVHPKRGPPCGSIRWARQPHIRVVTRCRHP